MVGIACCAASAMSCSSRFAKNGSLPTRSAPTRFCTMAVNAVSMSPAVYKAAFDWVVAAREDDRDCTGRLHGDERRIVASCRGDHGHLTSDEISRERRQPIQSSLRPAIFDRDVLTLDVTGFVQATAERAHYGSVRPSRLSIQ